MQNTRSGRKSGQMSWRRWVIDKDFQNQIDNGKVFTCEKHFEPDDMRHVSVWVVCNKHIWYPCKHDRPHKWCLIRVWNLYSYTDCCYTSLFFYFYFNSIGKDGQKTPKFGALPTFSMPKRTHDMVRPVACPLKSVVEDKPVTESL